MKTRDMRAAQSILIITSIMAMLGPAHAQTVVTPAEVRAKIEALKSPNVAWRKIEWKSCLLDGLRESREKKKPLMLWIFIDRPADDARC